MQRNARIVPQINTFRCKREVQNGGVWSQKDPKWDPETGEEELLQELQKGVQVGPGERPPGFLITAGRGASWLISEATESGGQDSDHRSPRATSAPLEHPWESLGSMGSQGSLWDLWDPWDLGISEILEILGSWDPPPGTLGSWGLHGAPEPKEVPKALYIQLPIHRLAAVILVRQVLRFRGAEK